MTPLDAPPPVIPAPRPPTRSLGGLCLVLLAIGHGAGWCGLLGIGWESMLPFSLLLFGLIGSELALLVVVSSAFTWPWRIVTWAVSFPILVLLALGAIGRPFGGPDWAFQFIVEVTAFLAICAAELQLLVWLAERWGWSFYWSAESDADSEATSQELDPPDDSGPPPLAQFRLWHLVALTAGVAALLGLLRLIAPWFNALPAEWILGVLRLMMILLPMVLLGFALGAATLVRETRLALWAVTLTLLLGLPAMIAVQMGVVYLANRYFNPWESVALNGTIAAILLVSLLLLRAAGLAFDRR